VKLDWALAHERLERARRALGAPEDERAVLERRARALAAPPPPPDERAWHDVVVFTLGGERFAAPADQVLEAVPLGVPTPLPGAPAHVLGVINHRGRVLGVFDLRERPGGELTHAVAVAAGGMTFAIAAEDVEEASRERVGERELTLLDLEALAADPRLRIDEEAR